MQNITESQNSPNSSRAPMVSGKAARHVLKNSIALFMAETMNKALTLVLALILARYLGEHGFGAYTFLFTLTMLGAAFANFGFDSLAIREIARRRESTEQLLANIQTLKILLSLVTLMVLGLFVKLIGKEPDVVRGAWLGAVSILFMSLGNTFDAVFTGQERLEFRAALLFSTKLVVFGLSLACVFLKLSIPALMTAILLSQVMRFVAGWLICAGRFAHFGLQLNPAFSKHLLRDAFPFLVLDGLALIYFRIDTIMLSVMKGDQAVGWYGAAFGLLEALFFIVLSYATAVFPLMSRYARSNKDALLFAWERSLKYLSILGLPIAVLVTFNAENVIHVLYSKEYSESIPALQILIWTLPLGFVNIINMRALYAIDKQSVCVKIVAFCTALNIGLNLFMIPLFSYIGCSITTVLCEAVNVSIFLAVTYRHLGSKTSLFASWSKPVAATAIMAILFEFGGRIHPLLAIPVALGAYAGFLALFKCFDAQDILLIRQMSQISVSMEK